MTRWTIPAVVLFALCACASAPEHLYSLEGAPRKQASGEALLPIVVVGPINVSELIDRPQLVLREGSYAVTVHEQQRWASPLKESIPVVIVDELQRACPQRHFMTWSDVPVAADSRLVVNVRNLDLSFTDGATLSADWSYRSSNAPARVDQASSQTHAGVDGNGYVAIVAAARRSLALFADDVASRLSDCR